jgi:hypothetical protein
VAVRRREAVERSNWRRSKFDGCVFGLLYAYVVEFLGYLAKVGDFVLIDLEMDCFLSQLAFI